MRRTNTLIERVTRARDHIWTWHPRPCWQCGRRCWWVEINFEAVIHRGACTDRAWTIYQEALRYD